MDKLKQLMKEYRERVDNALDYWLPTKKITPDTLHKAMRYSTFNGGKRIRPILVYMAGEALGSNMDNLDAAASAVECIHAYSLIHDDLPAMDDDDLRRGKPTCHKAFDEATAILAGDALQALAFHILAVDQAIDISAEVRLEMVNLLAGASGSRGMVGGQAIDLESVGKTIEIAELENMHIHKTGALIRCSVLLGALCAENITPQQRMALDHYAKCIGLAFQIQDDILDVESTEEELGKPIGSDIDADKPTYPSLLGIDESKQLAAELIQDAIDSLAELDDRADPLRWLAEYIITRKN
ncbi:MAG: (2E,6E)-farnesyl diphosphate synthase [Gammaproteobacteria bacterium]|nr:MAG: (2E,6E)-farnesyl diphosphate synthase [Gammaproteobacteria bacterium]